MHWLLGGYMWLFVHRPFEYYPILGELQLERAYMLLMILVWCVSPGKSFTINRLHLALVAFTIALAVCWLNSPWRDQCGDVLENQAKVMVFYLLFVTSVRDEQGLRRVLKMFLGAVGLYMAHSMLEFLNGRYEWRQGIVRMIGVDVTFHDPNSFASTLLLALVMTFPMWPKSRTSAARLPLLAFTALASVCILLTGSRTGFIGFIVVGFFALLVSRANKAVVLLFATSAILIVMAMPGYLQDRFLTLIDPSRGPANAQASAEGRLMGFTQGIELFEDNPLLGVGPGAFGFATGKGFNSHNVYGQVVSEMGLLGAFVFAGMLWCFWANWREIQRIYRRRADWPSDFPKRVARATGLSVLLMLVLGVAGHNLYRYIWIWLAAFQVVAVQCARTQALAADAAATPRQLPYITGPKRWGAIAAIKRVPHR